MKILVVQESNWITRNPHQQHHLMERLVNRGHEVRVIDFDIDWNKRDNGKIITKRKIFNNVYKISPNSGIQVIRPLSVNISIINYLVLGIFHFKEIKYQISEFNPDIILGFGILNAFIASICAIIYNVISFLLSRSSFRTI